MDHQTDIEERTREDMPLKYTNKLFGRDKAMASLQSAFRNAGKGYGRLLFIPGHSGAGKTSLVLWLKEPVERQNGWFVKGKFDQYHQNTPYYAIRHALSDLWKEMVEAHSLKPERLRDEIRESVGELVPLLVELIPALETIFGKASKIEDIHPLEARHRFTTAIQRFLMVACRPDHPVVLFLDDWQWADAASLEILKGLQVGFSVRYFLFIAAYRNEEVGKSHPLTTVMADLHRQSPPPEVIEVRHLSMDELNDLIQTVLSPAVENKEALILLTYEQTRGNPFYVKSFLAFLHENGFLKMDSSRTRWYWKIENTQLPKDIVDLFVRHLHRFSPETRNLMTLAACLGNRFDLSSLSIISDLLPASCLHHIDPVLKKGLIFQEVQAAGKTWLSKKGNNPWFKFMHDRVQQAAFLLIPQKKLADLRLNIGRRILKRWRQDKIDAHLFDVVNHLNSGADLIVDFHEQKQMVDLNREAARKARESTAFQAMLTFNRAAFQFARNMAGGIPKFWDEHYDDALSLFRALAESELLEGDRNRAETLIRESMDYTRSAVERAETLNILIVHYTLNARYKEAITTGKEALGELGIDLPEDDFESFRDREIEIFYDKLKSAPLSSLCNMPMMSRTEMRTATKLLITMGPPCYRTHQRLWSVIVPKVVNLTLQYGLMPQIGYSFTALGGLLGWVHDDYRTARELGDTAEMIMESRFTSPSDQSVFYLMVGSSTRHWFHHFDHAEQDYLKAYDIGLKSGNLQYAAYAFGHNMYLSFFRGVCLDDLTRDTKQSLLFSQSRLNHWAIDLLEGGVRVFGHLTGSEEEDGQNTVDEADYLGQINGNENIQVLCIYRILKMISHLILSENQQALDLSKDTEALLYTVGTQGLLPWPEYLFTRAMTLSALYCGAEEARQKRWIEELHAIQNRLQLWREHSQENYTHKYLLVSAELKRLQEDWIDAVPLYDRAIAEAHKNRFVQWEALANEKASLFWKELGNGHLAQIYRQQAYNGFRIWGAKTKLRQMESAFRDNLREWYRGIRHVDIATGHLTLQVSNKLQAPLENADALSRETGASGSHEDKTPPSASTESIFVEKQIDLMQRISLDRVEAQRKTAVFKEAHELAKATERLRIEIAERKRAEHEKSLLEEQIRHARKMEAIGTLAGGIAHEFNNLLAIIVGNIDLAEAYLAMNDPLSNHVDEIKTASLRARDVVQKLLSFSRKSPTLRGKIQIRSIIQDGLTLLRSTIPALIEIRPNIACTTEAILADPTEINQVLMNLCINAVHAMAEGPGILEIGLVPVTILADAHASFDGGMESSLQIDGQSSKWPREKTPSDGPHPPGHYALLSVTDTGSGIPSEIIDRIFDPYFTTKDIGEGLGMGLAIVHGIVKAHDGDIRVESEVGKGTSVKVLFPVIGEVPDETDPGEKDSKAQPGRNRKPCILVVDDEISIMTMLQKMIERSGYDVCAETSSAQALERFQKDPHRFDMIISDMTMPELSGDQLVQKIKAIRKNIPIILCTGHSERINEARVNALGVTALMTKPFSMAHMMKNIREILESNTRVS